MRAGTGWITGRELGHCPLPSIYDATYVVLTQLLGAELWTADERLLRLLGSVAPWGRWIGHYPSRGLSRPSPFRPQS